MIPWQAGFLQNKFISPFYLQTTENSFHGIIFKKIEVEKERIGGTE